MGQGRRHHSGEVWFVERYVAGNIGLDLYINGEKVRIEDGVIQVNLDDWLTILHDNTTVKGYTASDWTVVQDRGTGDSEG